MQGKDITKRPSGNNADEWAAWLSENMGAGVSYIAVQIAEAMDASEDRSKHLDRLQVPRILLMGSEYGQVPQGVCVGGQFDGWLMWQHPDGQWVSGRKLAETRP